MNNYFRIYRWLMIVVTSLAFILFFIFATGKIGEIYKQNTLDSIYNQKKIFIKDTVNNQIKRIEVEKEEEAANFQTIARNISLKLEANQGLSPEMFLDLFKSHFEQTSTPEIWTAVLWQAETGEVVYDPKNVVDDGDPEQTLQSAYKDFAVFHIAPYGKYMAFFGVKQVDIDNRVKQQIAIEIHNSYFADDTYIWINEVVHYTGGDNYAIRRVHPNLPETEGMLLSTNMTDIQGNFPYLEELEGVNKSGEIFFTYFFKKLNSDVISEKLTYSKLYKDFNWIVAMGIHLDDMQTYIDKANTESDVAVSKLVLTFVSLLVLILLVSYGLLLLIEKSLHRHSQKELENQANFDFLTNAQARRSGERELKKLFTAFQRGLTKTAIIMFDLDDLKKINDQFGHEEGDRILKEVVSTIKSGIRVTDKIYRWGGDEFVLICEGLPQDHVMELCDKLLRSVNKIQSHPEKNPVHITLSMGVSYFNTKDQHYSDVLKRADFALYQSKSNGKNQARFEIK